jgi:hypothetical protein
MVESAKYLTEHDVFLENFPDEVVARCAIAGFAHASQTDAGGWLTS